MRIAFSGTANTGKSTLLKDFLTVWDMYETPTKSYRDVIIESGLTVNKETTAEAQQVILDHMVGALKGKTAEVCVAYDRCPLDNFVYSLWAFDKGVGGIDEAFIKSCIPKVRESLSNLDTIFWIPYSNKIGIKQDSLRETDVTYIKEIDELFRSIYDQWMVNDKFYLFNPEDRPAIIEITSTDRQGRLREIGNYIDLSGSAVEPDEEWANELTGAETKSEATGAMLDLLKSQKEARFEETGLII